MKLICRVCSRFDDGGRITPEAAIAVVDPIMLGLPLEASMFGPLAPERGIPAPWGPGVTWERMFCPHGKHLPWHMPSDSLNSFVKNGGPDSILTDEGLVTLTAEEEDTPVDETPVLPSLPPLKGKKKVKNARKRW